MMMRHLLWKDVMTIKPLVAAILAGIVAIYVILMLLASTLTTTDSSGMFVSFWVLMPNLVALGAPALLVGGEEESGTLSWLRTLPIRWQKVADSKLLVALGGLVLAWVAATLCLLLASAVVFPDVTLTRSGLSIGLGASTPTAYVGDMLRFASIGYLLFFSLLLLLCGFVTAYLFRSPVSGLIAVVPLILLANSLATYLGTYILTGDSNYRGQPIGPVSAGRYMEVTLFGAGLLFVIWAAQRLLAFRRLASPQMNRASNLSTRDLSTAYRPPVSLFFGTARPSRSTALLWQQSRQMAWPALALTLVMGAFVFSASMDPSSNPFELAVSITFMGASWLGGLVFYGDNAGGRRSFFADRGISATVIWWTRLLIPVVCFVLLLVFVAAVVPLGEDRGITVLLATIIPFFIGMLVSQWMKRPVLTFITGPACAAIAMLVFLPMYGFYPNHVWTVLFVAPILLFASWRLTGRWVLGRIDWGYHWRVLAYSAAAIAVPFLAIVAQRIATTPELMPSWRSAMLAIDVPDPRTYANGRPIHSADIQPGTFTVTGVSTTFAQSSQAEQIRSLKDELDSDRIGFHVSMDDVNFAIGSKNRELHASAVKVLLKWARTMRQRALAGQCTLWDLATVAETSEERAVTALETWIATGPTPALVSLVDEIPDQQLRQDSRRVALTNEWKSYQSMDWDLENFGYKEFAKQPIGFRLSLFPFERTRADRFIDKLTHLLLVHLSHGLPDADSAEFRERDRLWSQALTSSYPATLHPMQVCRNWTRQHEDRIENLRTLIARQRSAASL